MSPASALLIRSKNHNHEVHKGNMKGLRPISLRVTFVPLVVGFSIFITRPPLKRVIKICFTARLKACPDTTKQCGYDQAVWIRPSSVDTTKQCGYEQAVRIRTSSADTNKQCVNL